MSTLPCFTPHDWRILASQWHPVALSRHLGSTPLAASLLDRSLVLHRSARGVAMAALDRCPHRGAALSAGRIDHGLLVCPYHGFHFEPSGRCVMIPANPELEPPAKLHLQMLNVREAYGLIWVRLHSGGTAELPPFHEWSAPGTFQVLPEPVDWATSAGRQMESFFDVSHFAFIHQKSFGEPDNTDVPSYAVVATSDGFQFDYVSTVSNYPLELRHLNPPGFLWSRLFRIHLPFCARLSITFPGKGLLHILNVAAPLSPVCTRVFSAICRNFDPDIPLQEAINFNRLIFDEDRSVVEQQEPKQLPLELNEEVHTPSDLASLTYRRALHAMGLS